MTSRQFVVDVTDTIRAILEQEDTDSDARISVDDVGPKVFSLATAASNGHRTVDIWVKKVILAR